MIYLKNIKKNYQVNGKSVIAIDDISLHVPKGKIFGVIGESGAGKSTLIRCVNLLEKPSSGKVIIDGKDITNLSEKQLISVRHKIGMIFQHFNLLSSRTVFDNVALPLELQNTNRDEIKQKVRNLLQLVGLEDKANHYPSNLSGGQKQRVAIARALTTSPEILLCDEATSALDPETTTSILNLIKDINKKLNITVLLITHEMKVIKQICDNVAILNHGRLIEEGTVADIFSNPQSELANKFISSSMDIHLPDEYLNILSSVNLDNNKSAIVKFNFSGADVDKPLISEVSRQFDVTFSILSAQIDYISGVKFGFVIAKVIGDGEQVKQTIDYVINNSVKVEVLGYV